MTEIKTARGTTIAVGDTGPSQYLEPVRLTVFAGVARLQDYLSPVQARELAAGLVAVAERAEAAQEVSG